MFANYQKILWPVVSLCILILVLTQVYRWLVPASNPVTDVAHRWRKDALGPSKFDSQDGRSDPLSSRMSPRRRSELLIDAVVMVESGGDPSRVGKHGERGLMQIKRSTWDQITLERFDGPLPYDRAFDPVLNRRVGRSYFGQIHAFLQRHRSGWKSDERSLLLGCYNAGPRRMIEASFDPKNLPSSSQSYIERVGALHDFYLVQSMSFPSGLFVTSEDEEEQLARRSLLWDYLEYH